MSTDKIICKIFDEPKIKVHIHDDPKILINFGSQGLKGDKGATGTTGPAGPAGTTVHSELSNLGYDESGHTNFQKKLIYVPAYKAFEVP